MKSRLRLHLRLIGLIGVIVPRRLRRDWRQEWEAELRYRERQLAEWERLTWASKVELLRRSLGAFIDALWLQSYRLEDDMFQDLRFGLRMLVKRLGFTIVAIITLALGLGANTAIFSFVNAALLRPLPFKEPDQLFMVWSKKPLQGNERNDVSLSDYLDWRDRNQVFSETAAFGPYGFNITSEAEPEKIASVVVTPNLFRTLGVEPTIGRDFLAAEAMPGRDRVVLLSYGLWQRRYGGDRDIVDRTIQLDNKSYTVVGVMPQGFRFPNHEVDIWAPLDQTVTETSRRSRWLSVIARLHPEVTEKQAISDLTTITEQLANEHPDTNTGWTAELLPLREAVVKDVRRALLLLFMAVGLVLLIVCVNVANLMLSHVESRHKELAIRSALGAGRQRLVRQLLTESILLSLVGGGLGLLLAVLGLRSIAAWLPAGPAPGPDDLSLLSLNQVGLDSSVFAFSLLLSLLTGALFGTMPLFQITRLNVNEALKESGRLVGVSSGRRLRNGLIVAEVALTVMLLTGAGLLLRSFVRLMEENPGFHTEKLLTFRLSPASKYRGGSERLNFYRQLVERLDQMPGVESIGATTTLPFSGTDLTGSFQREGRAPSDDGERPTCRFHSITPGYLQTMGIPVLRGRAFTEQDTAQSQSVVLINETMARLYFADEDPIGQRVKVSFGGEKALEIVGIVGDTRQSGLDIQVKAEVFVPYLQRPWTFMTFVIKTEGNPADSARAAKAQVWALDKDIPIYSVMTMAERLSESTTKRRFNMRLVGIFAFLSLILAAVGIYGVVSYTVSQRTQEIGIRMALGASRSEVFHIIVGQGMRWVMLGIAAGSTGAMVLSGLLKAMLYGVSATDPMTFAAVPLLLLTTALLACLAPAFRATKVDPLVALKYE